MAVELGPHQVKAIEEMRNGSILKGGVGTGKSRTALAYYYMKVCEGTLRLNGWGEMGEMKKPRDIYVITTAKKRDDKDWEKEAVSFLISPDPTISISGVKIVVDSWNNIINYTEVKDAFFIFDEQRLVGSGAWVKAFYSIAKNNKWVMLSATPGDNWMDYAPVFIANGFYKNRTEFLRQHVVFSRYSKFPKVDRYIETGRLNALRRALVVDMPYERRTKRHVRDVLVSYDEVAFKRVTKDRWHIYEDRPIRDIAELFIVMRKLVNSDLSRLEAVIDIVEEHPRLIIFYNFNHELANLRMLAEQLNIPTAEWNGHKHQPIPEGDRWLYLVQYTAGAEGWNCVTTNATVFYSLNYSYKINEQAMGRIDRLNTPYVDLFYYRLMSNSMIDKAIDKSLDGKKSFNEKDFMAGIGKAVGTEEWKELKAA